MEIRQLTDSAEKQAVTRLILEALPEWFGIPEAREEYIRESAGRIFFCAYDRNRPVGFLYLKETGNAKAIAAARADVLLIARRIRRRFRLVALSGVIS